MRVQILPGGVPGGHSFTTTGIRARVERTDTAAQDHAGEAGRYRERWVARKQDGNRTMDLTSFIAILERQFQPPTERGQILV